MSSFDARRAAVAGHVDLRTLRKALKGEPVSPMCLARIRGALAQLGLLDLLPSPSDSP
jgi:hypothetical protein